MVSWSDFFWGMCAGSALTILGMTAATYAVWHALLTSIVHHTETKGPWSG
jgi:H+/Cl- antiporter ClcA